MSTTLEDLTMSLRLLGLGCASCIYFVHTPNAVGVALGTCHRSSPGGRGWPVVAPHDWCGEQTLDETKLPAPAPTPLPGLDPDGDGLPLHDPTDCRFCQEQTTAVPFAPEV